jgi:hypothetical protein
MSVGKNRILWTARYLSVFLCWFISGAFAQAATFTRILEGFLIGLLRGAAHIRD